MTSLEGKRIFIVEDNVANMAVYATLLKKLGATVVQDHWNLNTLELIQQHVPLDLILLDLMLRHGVSGYDIFQQIRSHPEFDGIPIVAVSASDPEIEIPRAKAIGFAGFIPKPIRIFQFPELILQCIRGEPVWLNQSDQTH